MMYTQMTRGKLVHSIGQLSIVLGWNPRLCFHRLIVHPGLQYPVRSVLSSGGGQGVSLGFSRVSSSPLFQLMEINGTFLHFPPETAVILKRLEHLSPTGIFISRHEADEVAAGQPEVPTGVVQSGYISHFPA